MKKACKIGGIIVTALLAIVNLCRLIPKETYFGGLLNKLVDIIEINSMVRGIISVLLTVFGLAVAVNMVYEIKKEPTNHTLTVGSRRFYKFFAKWYAQPGTLSIICKDIEWTKADGDDSVFQALVAKSQAHQLNLFVDTNRPSVIVNELQGYGAKVIQASSQIIANYNFSCLSVMDNHSSVIVRDKQKDQKTNIKINEVSNTYVTGLLNALIEEKTVNE